eukprot:m51a1_g14808 hypothetical protein (258) ;mRNA; r:596922-598075
MDERTKRILENQRKREEAMRAKEAKAAEDRAKEEERKRQASQKSLDEGRKAAELRSQSERQRVEDEYRFEQQRKQAEAEARLRQEELERKARAEERSRADASAAQRSAAGEGPAAASSPQPAEAETRERSVREIMREQIEAARAQQPNESMETILHWCRLVTKRCDGVELADFGQCWYDGLAFCALAAKLRPDLLDWEAARQQPREQRVRAAFEALAKAGVPDLLGEFEVAEPLSIATYLSVAYDTLGPGRIFKSFK